MLDLGCGTQIFNHTLDEKARGFPEKLSVENLKLIAEAGFKNTIIDLPTVFKQSSDGFTYIGSWFEYHNTKHAEKLLSFLKMTELKSNTMHAPWGEIGLNISEIDEKERRHAVCEMLACLPSAMKLGVKAMAMHFDDFPNKGDPKCRLDQLRKSIKEILPEYERFEIKIAGESGHPNPMFPNPIRDLASFVREFNNPFVGVCFDTGHYSDNRRGMGGRPADAVQEFGDTLACLHIHDYNEIRDHITPLIGKTDFTGFVAALRKVGYTGPLDLEVTDHLIPEIGRASCRERV